MRRYIKLASTLVVALVPVGVFTSAGGAACSPGQTGTADCPAYTAPTTTAVPGPSMDGSVIVAAGGVAQTLFNGVVPPNGFMIQINDVSAIGNRCWISDNGPATLQFPQTGFLVGGVWVAAPLPNTFITPPGYKPMPVSIICTGGLAIAARGW